MVAGVDGSFPQPVLLRTGVVVVVVEPPGEAVLGGVVVDPASVDGGDEQALRPRPHAARPARATRHHRVAAVFTDCSLTELIPSRTRHRFVVGHPGPWPR